MCALVLLVLLACAWHECRAVLLLFGFCLCRLAALLVVVLTEAVHLHRSCVLLGAPELGVCLVCCPVDP